MFEKGASYVLIYLLVYKVNMYDMHKQDFFLDIRYEQISTIWNLKYTNIKTSENLH
jgi:hypothetical protein